MKKSFYTILTGILISFCLCAQTASAQNIVYITPSGGGNQDGSSWVNAKSAVDLSTVLRTSSGKEVWIAEGTYKPDNNRDSSFSISSGVSVYGGFAGNETTLSQRDWIVHPTIFSGDIGVANDTSDNCFHVVTFHNSVNSVLDGVTVTQGNANGGYPTYAFLTNGGGGIFIYAETSGTIGVSSPIIKNCSIKNNFGTTGGGMAIQNYGATKPHITNCSFDNNYSTYGGSGVLVSGNYSNTSPVFDSCIFENNFQGFWNPGGAVSIGAHNFGSGQPIIKNSTFTGSGNCALYVVNGSKYHFHTVIDSCTFSDNYSEDGSSSIIIANFFINNSTRISNCAFHDNATGSGSLGSIAIITPKDPNGPTRGRDTIINCRFYNNASYCEIKISATNGSLDSTLIANCLFYNPEGTTTILNQTFDGSITNTVFANNTIYATEADIINGLNGLISNVASTSPGAPDGYPVSNMLIQNCILQFPNRDSLNTFKHCLNNIQYGAGAQANLTTSHSLIQFATAGWPADAGVNGGNNLINVNPGFMDTTNANFHLNCQSPAVDAGSVQNLTSSILNFDLDGEPRVYGSQIDMGCYEQQGVPIPLALPDTSVNGMTIYCQANSNMSMDSLHWDFGDGTTSTQPDVNHTYMTNGLKTICLTVFTECGQADSCFQVQIGNNMGILSTKDNDTGIDVYPNPVSKNLTICNVPSSCAYRLISPLGSVVQSGKFKAGINYLHCSSLAPGVYYLQLSGKGRLIFSKPVVKQ